MSAKSEKVKECQKRKKKLAVERMGGKCSICGYDKCLSALDFHHIDPNTKEESPSYIVMRWKFEDCLEELSKCILVCANCHREIHDNECGVEIVEKLEREIKIKPFMSKVCERCGITFHTKEYEAKYCCGHCSHLSQRKVTRPSKSELKKLLDDRMPWTKIGKMFGVSDNAARKWAKQYEMFEYLNVKNKNEIINQ